LTVQTVRRFSFRICGTFSFRYTGISFFILWKSREIQLYIIIVIPIISKPYTWQKLTLCFCPFLCTGKRRDSMEKILKALIAVAAIVLEEILEDDQA